MDFIMANEFVGLSSISVGFFVVVLFCFAFPPSAQMYLYRAVILSKASLCIKQN